MRPQVRSRGRRRIPCSGLLAHVSVMGWTIIATSDNRGRHASAKVTMDGSRTSSHQLGRPASHPHLLPSCLMWPRLSGPQRHGTTSRRWWLAGSQSGSQQRFDGLKRMATTDSRSARPRRTTPERLVMRSSMGTSPGTNVRHSDQLRARASSDFTLRNRFHRDLSERLERFPRVVGHPRACVFVRVPPACSRPDSRGLGAHFQHSSRA